MQPTNPPEKEYVMILQYLIKNKTTYSLLRYADDVELINSIDQAPSDALLLTIEVTNLTESVFARRIDVKFALIEKTTDTKVLGGKVAARSRRGYNGAAQELGARLTRRISRMVRCFDSRRKELSSLK
jgi:hypothetical protein